jgi:hypothetical protein
VATKADFTEDEWKAMQKGLIGAGMLVSASDRDFTDSFGEASALARALAAQAKEASSELVRELAGSRGTGFGLIASPREVETETMESLRSALETLAAKAPDEAESYRRLVVDVAQAVAEAKSGVEPQETAALERLKETLATV